MPKIVAQCRKLSHSAENESFPIFVHCQTHSACAQNRGTFGSQSKSSVTRVEHTRLSATNQNRVLRNPSRQLTALRHTRELSAPGGPFSALGSSQLAIAYLNTWGPPDQPPPPPPPPQLTLLLLTWEVVENIIFWKKGYNPVKKLSGHLFPQYRIRQTWWNNSWGFRRLFVIY